MQNPSSTGGFAFARKADPAAQQKAMGAKKLDFDFGDNGDDFFNSFQPPAKVEANSNQLQSVSNEEANSTKVNDPFEMASS